MNLKTHWHTLYKRTDIWVSCFLVAFKTHERLHKDVLVLKRTYRRACHWPKIHMVRELALKMRLSRLLFVINHFSTFFPYFSRPPPLALITFFKPLSLSHTHTSPCQSGLSSLFLTTSFPSQSNFSHARYLSLSFIHSFSLSFLLLTHSHFFSDLFSSGWFSPQQRPLIPTLALLVHWNPIDLSTLGTCTIRQAWKTADTNLHVKFSSLLHEQSARACLLSDIGRVISVREY